MTSALRTTGSTRAWRRTLAATTRQLRADQAAGQPPACPYCHTPIRPGQAWDLDHTVPRIHGGTDYHLRPAHRGCNRAAGATTRRRSTAAPSRQW